MIQQLQAFIQGPDFKVLTILIERSDVFCAPLVGSGAVPDAQGDGAPSFFHGAKIKGNVHEVQVKACGFEFFPVDPVKQKADDTAPHLDPIRGAHWCKFIHGSTWILMWERYNGQRLFKVIRRTIKIYKRPFWLCEHMCGILECDFLTPFSQVHLND